MACWHVALQNGGDVGSRALQYVIIDHAQKRQPVYIIASNLQWLKISIFPLKIFEVAQEFQEIHEDLKILRILENFTL